MGLLYIVLIILVLFSGILSAAETSFFSLSSYTVNAYKHEKDLRKKKISILLSKPRELLVTIIILNIFANIMIQNTVSTIFGSFTSWLLKVGVPLVITLLFGEMIPKSIALPNNKLISYHLASFINFLYKIIKPLRIVMTFITSYVSRFMFFFLKKEKAVSIKELRHVIDKSNQENILTSQESNLIGGYLDLLDTNVKEHMMPRGEVLYYDLKKPIDNLISIFSEKHYTRIPVCEGDLHNLLGVITLKHFFLNRKNILEKNGLKKLLKKPLFVVETMKAWDLLVMLKQKNEDMAMVVDEYGSITGIITQEDLMEKVIGNISDKKDEEMLYNFTSKNELIVSGKLQVDDLENILKIKLKKRHAVTIAGYLIEEIGDFPIPGQKIIIDNLFFYILASDKKSIKKIYIRILKKKSR